MSRVPPKALGPPSASEMYESTHFVDTFNPADEHNKILLSEIWWLQECSHMENLRNACTGGWVISNPIELWANLVYQLAFIIIMTKCLSMWRRKDLTWLTVLVGLVCSHLTPYFWACGDKTSRRQENAEKQNCQLGMDKKQREGKGPGTRYHLQVHAPSLHECPPTHDALASN